MLVKPHKVEMCQVEYYLKMDEIKAAYPHQYDLSGNCYLFVNKDKDHWWEYLMVQFAHSDLDYSNMFVSHVFSGCGTPNVLRELRHTYWGHLTEDGSVDGYTFYLPGQAVIEALNILKEWFDI